MLDLDHPQTAHIFKASALEDALKMRAQRMSVSPTAQRVALWQECEFDMDELRRLNRAHFENSAFIAQALDEAELFLNDLARAGAGQITQDHSDGEGVCPVCDTPISKLEINIGSHYRLIVSCDVCIEPWWAVEGKLSSPEGFGTCFI